MSPGTALLVFARSSSSDAARKRVGTHPVANRRVVERLNERTRQTAEATGLPVIHSTTLIAHTGTFGNQLARALRATFALGYDRVLVIGNDCPALTTALLTQATRQLETESVVVGPDRRGGLYLLGLSRAVFEGVSPARLPWQTSQLAQAVRQLYAGESTAWLPQLSDVNSQADLQHYQASSSAVASFIALLLTLDRNAQTHWGNTIPDRFALVFGGLYPLRAPPACHATVIGA